MANHDGARLTMLRVLPPDSSDALAGASNEGIVGVINSTIKVVRDASPVDAVIREAPGFDLLIIGVAAQWELQSQVFGFRAQRIVRDCPGSILMVRSHLVQTAPAPSGPVNL